ncbi:MAG: SEC-C domain-containing protein [Phycisphaerae bacterium]|nr:SEC-C domain-containing protein [Phycisphaerae bacterium]
MAILEVVGKGLLKIFGSSSDRYVKKHTEFIQSVSDLEAQMAQLTDSQLLAKSQEFKTKIKENQEEILAEPMRELLTELRGMPEETRRPAKAHLTEQLDLCCTDILAEAFAAVREASDRHLGIRNIFKPEFKFDSTIFTGNLRSEYDDILGRVAAGEDIHKIDISPEFYAFIREKYPVEHRNPYRFRHFDVQMVGGRVLYEGKIAEMATGEGKTLVATLAAYLVAISGRKVHVITVNDYLAKRDRDWMAPVYEALGVSVGAIQSEMSTIGETRQQQYGCDITYGTNNEFGFDYLRDNMKASAQQQVQGPLDYTVIDEVDSILIDEARTPLIISGPARDDVSRYKKSDTIAREIIRRQAEYNNIEKQVDQRGKRIANMQGEISEAKKEKNKDRLASANAELEKLTIEKVELEDKLSRATQFYEVEYDRHSAHLTHDGIGLAQELADVGSFYVGSNMEWPHLMEQAIRAHVVFEREKDYVVQDNEVIIVDEFTGRLMQGRQWSDGLHQAVEAKENVTIKQESQTLATITLQNFFKMYQQLAGMTGTAMTEDTEFMNIYQLAVVAVPTNKPIIRDDRDDLIYRSQAEKLNAITDEIFRVSKSGQPVLIGTTSIEKNEELSEHLTKRFGLEHEVLNAKQHAREATIVEKAGFQRIARDGSAWGNVTIATNMAGRGTDIKLTPEVLATGGLYVLGTERHEARRIDNQLRGRCGRQGDPGVSQFFLSFDDDLMSIFAAEWVVKALGMFGLQEGEPIQHKQISKGVAKAQKKVEQRNYESRKSLLEYDEVMDFQRQVFYTRRQAILEGRGLKGLIWEMNDEVISEVTATMLDKTYPYDCIIEWAKTVLGVDLEQDRVKGQKREAVENTLRVHAINSFEQEISMTLGEYIPEDAGPDQWDTKGLVSWAMSKYNVNFSQAQIRKLTYDDVQIQLNEAAAKKVENFDMTKLGDYLKDNYGIEELCQWFNQKFGLEVKIDEINPENAEQYLIEKAQNAYLKREVDYPVDFIVNIALRRQQQGEGLALQDIVGWTKWKFGKEISADELSKLSFDELRDMLIVKLQNFRDNAMPAEVSEKISACDFDNAQAVVELAQWSNERYKSKFRDDELNKENAKEKLQDAGLLFARSELTDLERYVLLQIYDTTWKDHLYAMDQLKSGIGLRGFAEKDPKMEYKREGYQMFQSMLSSIRDKVTDIIFKAQLEGREEARSVWNISSAMHDDFNQFQAQQDAAQRPQGQQRPKTIKHDVPKVGRNDPCPCGSGKKYKKCCGK